MCPSCTRDKDGIAAKLLRCGIASEALRRNMPLSTGVLRGPSRKVPHGVLFECFWAPASECPKECSLSAFCVTVRAKKRPRGWKLFSKRALRQSRPSINSAVFSKRGVNLLAGDNSSEGAVSRQGGQGSKIYVLSSEPKEHKSFCLGTRPGNTQIWSRHHLHLTASDCNNMHACRPL